MVITQNDLGLIPLWLSFLSKDCGRMDIVTLPLKIHESLQRLSLLPVLMPQYQSGGGSQCRVRYSSPSSPIS